MSRKHACITTGTVLQLNRQAAAASGAVISHNSAQEFSGAASAEDAITFVSSGCQLVAAISEPQPK
jgi:hypothetical protein